MSLTSFRISATPALLLSVSLAGCAAGHAQLPEIALDAPPIRAVETAPPPAPVVAVPEPLPLPAQLKPLDDAIAAPEPSDPAARIDAANAAARLQPVRDGFVNAIQLYPWTEGALYQLYAAPGQVTDIALQEGEQLVGAGPVAAGDTARWIIGDTVSGSGTAARVHILVKPVRSGIVTNLVINTDRRTYHLELRATSATYMASVSWSYPHDALRALGDRNAAAQAAAPIASGLDLDRLAFRYRIEGDDPPWRPLRAFDDGVHVYVEFPPGIGQSEMPPLFVIGPAGGGELVNYRVAGRHLIVDRLFAAAELRLGDGKSARTVRIMRSDAQPKRRRRR